MEVLLKNYSGFQWKKYGGISLKGSLGNSEKNFSQVISCLDDEENSFVNLLKNNNQFFSIVYEGEDYVYAAVDHLRMYPLFYSFKNGDAYLSDDANWIRAQISEKEMDQTSVVEFSMTGYVTGSDTLYPNVKQLQAGEYLKYDRRNQSIAIKHYCKYEKNNETSFNPDKAINDLDDIHIKVFQRLIKSLNGRTAVLPLSAGYDSRVIAMMLKRLGYEDVVCFTYGKPGNWEASVSKEIADALNYKWFFISYTPEKWKKWFNSAKKEEFFEYSNGLTSLTHIQDHLALAELKEKDLIPKDSVIIPGHTAMLSFAGYNQDFKTMDQNAEALLKKHYSLWDWSYKDSIHYKEKLADKILDLIDETGQTVENSFYLWEMRERHAKFICNSVRAYEHLGYEWRMPLWEKEMVNYWLRIPQEYRKGKKIYKDYFDIKFSKVSKDLRVPNKAKEQTTLNPLKVRVKKCQWLYKNLVKVKQVKAYYHHPLDWYKIVSFNQYLNGLIKGADNINSYLIEQQLESIRKE